MKNGAAQCLPPLLSRDSPAWQPHLSPTPPQRKLPLAAGIQDPCLLAGGTLSSGWFLQSLSRFAHGAAISPIPCRLRNSTPPEHPHPLSPHLVRRAALRGRPYASAVNAGDIPPLCLRLYAHQAYWSPAIPTRIQRSPTAEWLPRYPTSFLLGGPGNSWLASAFLPECACLRVGLSPLPGATRSQMEYP